jgi:hypothetical protein
MVTILEMLTMGNPLPSYLIPYRNEVEGTLTVREGVDEASKKKKRSSA